LVADGHIGIDFRQDRLDYIHRHIIAAKINHMIFAHLKPPFDTTGSDYTSYFRRAFGQ